MEEFYFPPRNVSDLNPWFANFISKLEPVYANYDITTEEFNQFKADQIAFNFVNGRISAYDEAISSFVSTRNTMWSGDPDHAGLREVEIPGQVKVETNVPPFIRPNIYQRIKSLVLRLREHPKMTKAMAKSLGILPWPEEVINPNEYTPVLKVKVQNGLVILDCPVKIFSGYEIWIDDQGGTNFINELISVSRYWTDNRPLPDGQVMQLRSYRVRMLMGNKAVGNFSNIVQGAVRKMMDG